MYSDLANVILSVAVAKLKSQCMELVRGPSHTSSRYFSRVIKEIIFRAARRVEIKTTLVANQALSIPASPFIDSVIVKAGLAVASKPGDRRRLTSAIAKPLPISAIASWSNTPN